MSDIPADVMAAAERTHQLIMANQSTETTAVIRIARAIMAERERCAEIADRRGKYLSKVKGYRSECTELATLAAAIRGQS